MSKKTKKGKVEGQVENTGSQTTEENHIEIVPSTIVESTEAQVFAGRAEEQTVATEASSQAVDSQAVASEGETQPEEKPAPKQKVDRRPYIPFLTEALEQPQDRKALLKTILEKWPTVSKGGCQTFMTDMLNAKYTHFKDRPVVKLADGKVVFADKAPVAEGAQETAEPSPVEADPEAATQDKQPGE